MTLLHHLPADIPARSAVDDDVADVTDRRRLLLQFLFGIDVDPSAADVIFAPDDRIQRRDGSPASNRSPTTPI